MADNSWEAAQAKKGPDDVRLGDLLRKWHSIEPKANFETAVWRGIHTATAPGQRRFPALTTLRDWFAPRPAWVNAMAVAAGIVVGVGLAFSTPTVGDGRQADEPLLHSQTMAGSYLALVTGETR